MRVCGLAALVAIWSVSATVAQDYPTRTVTVVSPYAPGGMSSLLGRAIGQRLEQRFGKPFVIENRPGGGTIAGALAVAHAAPDGHTLLMAPDATMATNVTLYKSLPYDPATDFVPLAQVALVPEVLVVHAQLPVHSLGDLVRLAKSAPSPLTFGSAGLGSPQHINGELLKQSFGIAMTHVPYRGIAPALNDVAGGHIALMFTDIPVSRPLIDAGKLRPLGVTTADRLEALPGVPPLAEIGLPGFDRSSWFGLFAPAKTPRNVVDKLSAAIRDIVSEPSMRAEFNRLGVIPGESQSIDELRNLLRAEITRSGDVLRRIGLAGSEQSKE